MTHDPFESLPNIPEEELDAGQPPGTGAHEAKSEERRLRKGASRGLGKQLSKWLMLGGSLAIGVWYFFGDEPTAPKAPAEKKELQLDQSKQTADTSALLTTLQQDASKRDKEQREQQAAAAAKNSASSAQVGGNPAAGMPTPVRLPAGEAPVGSSTSARMEADRKASELERRREEMLAAPLEAQGGTFKLFEDNEATRQTPATVAKSRLNALEQDLANMQRERAAARPDATGSTKVLEEIAKMNGAGQSAGTRRDQNVDFLQENSAEQENRVLRQHAPAPGYLINEGTPIRSVLLTGLNSDLPGKITALVTEDVYDSITQKAVLIPKYSKLIGRYNSSVVVGQGRILIAMTRLILPDGTWISLAGATASDSIGQSGIEADVDNHFVKILGTSAILGAASFMLPSADRVISNSMNNGGVNVSGGTIAGMALSDAIKLILDRNKAIQPTLKIIPGEPFIFMAAHDMSLVPYHRR